MSRRLLRPLVLGLLLALSPSSHGAETRESWRLLTVHVASAEHDAPLAGVTILVDVLGAPVWAEPREVEVGARGTAGVWIPRWGGPVVVTARAEGHVPTRVEAGPEGTLSLRLSPLPPSVTVRLALVDAEGRRASPSAVPEHAVLHVRAFGSRVDDERFAAWTAPARPAFEQGIELPAGTCDLCLRAPAWVPGWTRVVASGDAELTVPLPERAVQPLLVEVVDAASGNALPEALVRYRGWGKGQVRADAAGRLEIPYLPGERLPDAVTLEWSLPGWARDRFCTPESRVDGRVGWRLGMHRTVEVRIPVHEASGRLSVAGVAWSIAGPWPTERRRVLGGVAEIQLPADGGDGALRYAFASTGGFRVVDAATLRAGAVVELRPWRRIRAVVDRVGEPCPGSCQVGLHLLPPVAGALDPTDLPPWAWTADISASGVLDTAVPEDEGAVLQVDVWKRTAFFRASELWASEAPVLTLGPETETAPRTLVLVSADGAPVPGANVELRWWSPSHPPRPLDLVYRGQTDAEGRFRHYGPAGPYSVVVSHGRDLHAPNVDLGYDAEGFAELRLPAPE